MTIWITINRHTINRNTKYGKREPPIRVSRGKYGKPRYCRSAKIEGPSTLVYDPHNKILPCGARLAIKTEARVRLK